MTTAAPSDDDLRRYLRGTLSEAEEARVEDAYFDDPELLAKAEACERLIMQVELDDYLAGKLSDRDREWYERRLLEKPEYRQDVAVARAIYRAAVAAGVEPPANFKWEPAPRAPWPRWVLPLAAVVVLALAAQLLTRARTSVPAVESAQQAPAVSPSAPAPAPPVTAPEAPSAPPLVLATVLLQSGITRGASDVATLRQSSATTHVDVQFPADATVTGASARIETPEGTVVFTGPIDAAPAPHVRVPAASLPAGDYLVVVVPARRDPAADPPEFTLRVR